MIDLNDFDEAHPGGWEWDLRRLVASIWVAGRHNGAAEEHCASAVRSCVRPIDRSCNGWPTCRCSPGPSSAWTSIGWPHETAGPLQAEVDRAAKRARNRTSDRALPRFTHEVAGVRRIVEEPPLITRLPDRGGRAAGRGARRVPADAGPALAAGARRLHPGRRRAQGGRGGQRRAARLRGPAGGLHAGGRGVPAAQAGSPVGAGPVRARRLGLARAPGPAGRGVPAGAADGQRPAAGLDHGGRPAVLRAAVPEHEGHRSRWTRSTRPRSPTTRAWWASCWPRDMRGPAGPR